MGSAKSDVISDALQLSAANPHNCVETQVMANGC
jgi:hypothetical protein